MTVEEAAEYTRIPLGTLYMKLGDGTIPATKPGKRYVLYQDEFDKWLEAIFSAFSFSISISNNWFYRYKSTLRMLQRHFDNNKDR